MQTRACFLLLFAVAVVVGCGKKPGIATFPVTGTVTYQGKPVAGASVTYNGPVDSTTSSGTTDSEGKFSLSTYLSPKEVLPGAVPGDYKVAIIKKAGGGTTQDTAAMENLTDEERRKKMTEMMQRYTPEKQKEAGAEKEKPEIPEKYAKPETSGLTATVYSGDNPPKEFKLTDD